MTKPKVSLIWAEDRQRLIGCGGALPWHLAEDMAWFRRQTMGKAILMGRKTFDSIGKALPGRVNLVQSRGTPALPPACHLVNDIDAALQVAQGHDELMIMGGSEIYRLWLPLAQQLYVTHLDEVFSGDVHFPELDWSAWSCSFREQHEAAAGFSYRFMIYQKNDLA